MKPYVYSKGETAPADRYSTRISSIFKTTKEICYMRRKPDLHIRFFNDFAVSSPYHEYAPSAHNSTQLTLLISYLVANQDTKVPKDVLMAMLWPDEKDKCPVGALRNLVYRARKELEHLYPDKDVDYIKFTQDAYYWNPDLYCKIDIHDFENYNNLARQEPDPERQFRYYYRMHRLYTGEFLSNHTSIEWVQYRITYYKNMYINCTMNMCEYLYTRRRYDELIALCDQSIIFYPDEDRFYRYKLLAYLGMNTIKTALEYYHTTLDFFSSKYGTDISGSLRDVHQEILLRMPSKELDINELETTLGKDDKSGQTFYCNFDIFKNIYHLHSRSSLRMPGRHYLMLLTLHSKKGKMPDAAKVKEVMETLYYMLSTHLRKNDVFTRTSLTQYSVLLCVTEKIGVDTVADRINEAFHEMNPNSELYLEVSSKEI